MTSYATGLFTEFLTRLFLRIHGFRILKSRYVTGHYTNRAEIDIIAKKANLIVFVEVKKRRTTIDAFNAISATQVKRLRRAAETFLAQNHWSGDARFDVVIFTPFKIQWFKGAL